MSDFGDITDAEHAATFDPIHDVAERYGLTFNEAEVFLENSGYYGDPDDPDTIKQPRGAGE